MDLGCEQVVSSVTSVSTTTSSTQAIHIAAYWVRFMRDFDFTPLACGRGKSHLPMSPLFKLSLPLSVYIVYLHNYTHTASLSVSYLLALAHRDRGSLFGVR